MGKSWGCSKIEYKHCVLSVNCNKYCNLYIVFFYFLLKTFFNFPPNFYFWKAGILQSVQWSRYGLNNWENMFRLAAESRDFLFFQIFQTASGVGLTFCSTDTTGCTRWNKAEHSRLCSVEVKNQWSRISLRNMPLLLTCWHLLYCFFITIFGSRYLFHFPKCCVFISNAVKVYSGHILTIINYLFNVRSCSKLRK